MKQQIATTREQSNRLLQCGVPAYAADMTLSYCKGGFYELMATPFHYGCFNEEDAPAFSLSCLLSLLPKEIYDENGDSYYFSIAKEFPLTEEYGAAYIPCWEKGDAIVRKRDNNPIDACVQLIEWLAEDGYNLNGIEKGGEK